MSSSLHVYPVNDYFDHKTDDAEGECLCEPEIQWLDPETGLPWKSGDGPLIIHNALDGRE